MKKKCFLIFIILFLAIILTACWDLRDIDERAIIIALGIDFEEIPGINNFEYTQMIRLTAQIAISQQLGGGAGEAPGMGEESVSNVTVIGRNISMALANLQQRLQSEIFLGHIRVVVVSEDVAREGLGKYINFFNNNTEFRRLSYLIISENKAENLLNTYPKTSTIQGMFLMRLIEDELKRGTMPDISFIEFVIRLFNKGRDPITIMINSYEEVIKYSGLAVFRGDRMVGKLNKEEGWNFIQLTEKRIGGIEVVRDVYEEIGHVTILFTNNDVSIKPVRENENFLFKVNINLEGKIMSQETYIDYSNKILFNELERRVSNEVKREMESLYYKVQQQYSSDIFGFGELVRAYLPSEWNKVENWQKEFKKAKLEIDINMNIRRVGLQL